MTPADRDALILAWLQAKDRMEQAKEEEAQLRKQIAYLILDIDRIENYSIMQKLGNGYGIKATQILNYKTDENSAIEECLNNLYQGGFVEASSIFRWKASLNESVYKKLSNEARKMVDEVLSVKIGMPQLEFISPEKK